MVQEAQGGDARTLHARVHFPCAQGTGPCSAGGSRLSPPFLPPGRAQARASSSPRPGRPVPFLRDAERRPAHPGPSPSPAAAEATRRAPASRTPCSRSASPCWRLRSDRRPWGAMRVDGKLQTRRRRRADRLPFIVAGARGAGARGVRVAGARPLGLPRPPRPGAAVRPAPWAAPGGGAAAWGGASAGPGRTSGDTSSNLYHHPAFPAPPPGSRYPSWGRGLQGPQSDLWGSCTRSDLGRRAAPP